MRFKTFYLQEKQELILRKISELSNIISGAAGGKDIEGADTRDKGVYFQITSIGAWSVFKKKLKETLNWEEDSKDSTNLLYVNGKYSLYIKLDGTTAKFYLTNKKVEEPEWNSSEDKEESDSSTTDTSKEKPEDTAEPSSEEAK